MFAATVVISAKLVQPVPWHRSILKPSSLLALSVQERLIWLLDAAVAARVEGAAGAVADVVALPVFEYPELPPLL